MKYKKGCAYQVKKGRYFVKYKPWKMSSALQLMRSSTLKIVLVYNMQEKSEVQILTHLKSPNSGLINIQHFYWLPHLIFFWKMKNLQEEYKKHLEG